MEQGGFAAAVGTQDAQKFPPVHLEIQAREDRAVLVAQIQRLYPDHHIPRERRDLSR